MIPWVRKAHRQDMTAEKALNDCEAELEEVYAVHGESLNGEDSTILSDLSETIVELEDLNDDLQREKDELEYLNSSLMQYKSDAETAKVPSGPPWSRSK